MLVDLVLRGQRIVETILSQPYNARQLQQRLKDLKVCWFNLPRRLWV